MCTVFYYCSLITVCIHVSKQLRHFRQRDVATFVFVEFREDGVGLVSRASELRLKCGHPLSTRYRPIPWNVNSSFLKNASIERTFQKKIDLEHIFLWRQPEVLSYFPWRQLEITINEEEGDIF